MKTTTIVSVAAAAADVCFSGRGATASFTPSLRVPLALALLRLSGVGVVKCSNATPYGCCPTCGAECVERERRKDGNDKCANGHTYKSALAVMKSSDVTPGIAKAEWSDAAREAAAEARKNHSRLDKEAMSRTQTARNFSDKAKHTGLAEDHQAAADKHDEADLAHTEAAKAAREAGDHAAYTTHHDYAESHFASSNEHKTSGPYKATEAAAPGATKAAGTSEGAKKAWETKHYQGGYGNNTHMHPGKTFSRKDLDASYSHVQRAMQSHDEALNEKDSKKKESWNKSATAHEASAKAFLTGNVGDHGYAAQHHQLASKAHHEAGEAGLSYGHGAISFDHQELTRSEVTKATTPKEGVGVVLCRDSGCVIKAKAWAEGKETSWQWMPGGVHTIVPTVTILAEDGTIQDVPVKLTVKCDASTAKRVSEHFAAILAETPNRPPFGCIEHREQERSVRPTGFDWDGEGVRVRGIPSSLGAKNVSGDIHSSWSPAFATDADNDKLVMDADGVWKYPAGARGSEQNPAEVVGIHTRSIGSLTNWPAFKSILPVTAADTTAGTGTVKAAWSDAARAAALEARRLSGKAKDEPMKRSMNGKPRAHEDAYKLTLKAHTASLKTAKQTGMGGYDMDDHNYAKSAHMHAADAHDAAGDSEMAEMHRSAAEAHKVATDHIYKETHAAKAAEAKLPSLADVAKAHAPKPLPTTKEIFARVGQTGRTSA